MNVHELIRAFRVEISDIAKPYLVSDETALRYLNEAQLEASRRAHLLVDSTSPASQACVSLGDSVVSIDPRIISIRRMRLASETNQLRKVRSREMDDCIPGWDAETSQSTPIYAVMDYGTNQLYLYPTPSVADDLLMTVVREPVNTLAADTDVPEIAPRWNQGLIEWMKFRSYINDDSELFNEKQAARALATFEQEFGPKRSALDEVFESSVYNDIGEL